MEFQELKSFGLLGARPSFSTAREAENLTYDLS